MSMYAGDTGSHPRLRGLVTEADLAAAELHWPGMRAFLLSLPSAERPRTFLDLVWRFEAARRRAS
jgi:hypothetical protein